MKTLGKNKKAYFDYDILERFEAGVVLAGWEVKSLKAGLFSLKSSFVIIKDTQVFVIGMNIARWKTQSRTEVIDETRQRKLLLNKREIKKLKELLKNRGTSALVLRVLEKSRKVKFEIGVGRGKRKYDKREAIKKKEFKREIKAQGTRW